MDNPLLKIEKLCIWEKENIKKRLIHQADLYIQKNSITCLVGESGSGKSLTACAILGLCPENLCMSGRIEFNNTNLLALSEKELSKIRGKKIGFVMQNCSGALNPLLKNGSQLKMLIKQYFGYHTNWKKHSARLLTQVYLPDPLKIIGLYPHQLSGGMKQRLLTAMGMSGMPELLIMDEPTKGMDLALRNNIAHIIHALRTETGITILLITHDLHLAYTLSDTCYVMHKGRLTAAGKTRELFDNPQDKTLSRLLKYETALTDFFTID